MIPEYKRETLRFQRTKSRPELSPAELEYWGDFLQKVVKVGTEFEINLPDPRKSLGKPENEACIRAGDNCSRDCANVELCLVDRHPVLCSSRKSGTFLGRNVNCPAEDDQDTSHCPNCPFWLLECLGKRCAMFTPYCDVCPSFLRKGETVENADIRQDAETVRREVRKLLEPTENIGRVGKTGALKVTHDNSLVDNGGIEIPTVGRRVHWASFYNMTKDIIRPIAERGGYLNERCGQHYHILAGYLPKGIFGQELSELERPVPEIILANLHQLHRRYELAMFWLMSAGDTIEHLTRWARFRQSLMRFSALKESMVRVQKEMSASIISMTREQKGKYAAVSYEHCRFDESGHVSCFHIENRIADGAMSPAAITAWAMLCYALVLKAVRISGYGVLETGSQDYIKTLKEIQPHLISGERSSWQDARTANTRGIGPYIPWLQGNAKELIQLLKPELSRLGPAYRILYSLANKPLSLRRVEGNTWEEIEEDLYGEYRKSQARYEADGSYLAIQEIVDLASVIECDNLESWEEEVAANLGKDVSEIREVVRSMINDGSYRWSEPIGGLITT